MWIVRKMQDKKTARLNSEAGQIRRNKEKRSKQIERLSRRILFVIRWSNFDNYWYVVDALESLSKEYRLMLADAGEIIQKGRELVEVLEQERSQ